MSDFLKTFDEFVRRMRVSGSGVEVMDMLGDNEFVNELKMRLWTSDFHQVGVGREEDGEFLFDLIVEVKDELYRVRFAIYDDFGFIDQATLDVSALGWGRFIDIARAA